MMNRSSDLSICVCTYVFIDLWRLLTRLIGEISECRVCVFHVYGLAYNWYHPGMDALYEIETCINNTITKYRKRSLIYINIFVASHVSAWMWVYHTENNEGCYIMFKHVQRGYSHFFCCLSDKFHISGR